MTFQEFAVKEQGVVVARGLQGQGKALFLNLGFFVYLRQNYLDSGPFRVVPHRTKVAYFLTQCCLGNYPWEGLKERIHFSSQCKESTEMFANGRNRPRGPELHGLVQSQTIQQGRLLSYIIVFLFMFFFSLKSCPPFLGRFLPACLTPECPSSLIQASSSLHCILLSKPLWHFLYNLWSYPWA